MAQDFPKLYEEMGCTMGQLGTEIPDVMKAFSELHHAAGSDSALSAREKELIALGISIVIRCEGCIAFHIRGSLDAGATRQQITDAIGVAILMGGGPSVMYGCEALNALDQFKTTPA